MADTQRRGGTFGFLVGFGIAIPATIFALSNLESATVEFLGWQAEVPLWAVIALSFLAGALLGVIVLLAWQARRSRGKKKVAKRAEREKQAARNDTPALPGTASDDSPTRDAHGTGGASSPETPGSRAP